MIEVEAPDGSIVEFPDGTPKDVMSAAMRKKFSAAPAAAPQPAAAAGKPNREVADKLYDDHFALTMSRADFYDQMGLDSQEVRQPSAVGAAKRAPSALNRSIAQGIEGIARLPAMVVDAPANMVVDPINAGLRAVGVDYQIPRSDTYGAVEQLMEPVEQSAPGRAVTGALDRLGERWAPEQPAPKNFAEQAVDYTAELVGSSLPYMVAPYLRAGSAVTAANAPTTMGRVWQDMQRRAATAPISTAALETTSAVGAGVGGSIAQEVAPGNFLAEMVGQLFGGAGAGLVPTVLASRVGVGGAKKVRDYMSETGQERRTRQKVGEMVGDIDAASRAAAEADTVERAINEAATKAGSPEMRLSLAERTRSPAVAAEQRNLESNLSGAELDDAIARYQGNEDAISAFARQAAPKSDATVDDVAIAAGRRGDKARTMIDNAIARIHDSIAQFARDFLPNTPAAADDVTRVAAKPGDIVRKALDERVTRNLLEQQALSGKVPTADLAEKGRLLRDELNAQRIAVRDQFDRRATAEGLDNVDVTLNFRNFQDKVEADYALQTFDNPAYRPRVLDDVVAFGKSAPEEPGGLVNTGLLDERGQPVMREPNVAAKPDRQPVSFQDVKRLRERITTDLRVAQRSNNPTERERARTLTKVLRDFDDMIVGGELTNAAPNVAAKWRQFRQDYKTDYVDVFRPPQMKDIRGRDIDGFEEMADEAVAAELFKPGNVTMARRFKDAIRAANDGEAVARATDAIEFVAMDSLNKAAVRNGAIDPALLATWKRNHQSMLDEFPYLKEKVENVQQASTALVARNAKLTARKQAVQKSVMERKLAQVESGAKTPDALIDDALKNYSVATRLVSRLRGDDAALNNLRDVVKEKIPLNDPKAALKFLSDNERSLSTIFTPKQVSEIRQTAIKNQLLLDRGIKLEARKKAVDRSVIERKLAAVEAGSKTPEALIDEAVKNHSVAARLVTRLRGDETALTGLRQAVWQKLPLDDPNATIKFLADNERSLAAIFTPQHIDDIRTIAAARSMAETVRPPAGKPVDTNPLGDFEKGIGSTIPSLSATARAIRMGRSSWFYEVPARGMQLIHARMNKYGEKAMRDLLYNPDVARTLRLAAENPLNLQSQEKLRRTLWNYGLYLDPDRLNARLPGGFIQAEEGREEE